jgi:dipeptidase E
MMLRHPGETGVAIDHFAALVVDGDDYRVVSPEGRPGSSDGDGAAHGQRGRPAIWRMTVVDGHVRSRLLPAQGGVARVLTPADTITDDPRLAAARAANPDDFR